MKHLKQEFDKLTFKESLSYGIAIMSIVLGFVLLFCGMFTEPKGQIHESVLTAFGLVLIFVGTIIGISNHSANELVKIRGAIPGLIQEMLKWSDKTSEHPQEANGKEATDG